MGEIFLKLVNMSLSASVLILAVLLARLLFKKAPKWVSCLLWALVAVRLLCPYTIESPLSLIPDPEPVPREALNFALPEEPRGMGTAAFLENLEQSGGKTDLPIPAGPEKTPVAAYLTVVWLLGVGELLLYGAVSYGKLRRLVRVSARVEGNVYRCDRVPSPFILGVLRPRIYLPPGMDEAQRAYVLAHENAHLARRDHWWKPLGFLILAVYWFNPMIWVAYILLCRDIELACDERVVEDMALAEKKAYSMALLECSVPRKRVAACPLAFGEVSVKNRVKNVLDHKKPAFWVMFAAALSCMVLTVCFLTDPKAPEPDHSLLNYENIAPIAGEQEALPVTLEGRSLTVPGETVGRYLASARWEEAGAPEGALAADLTVSVYDFLSLRFFAGEPNLVQVDYDGLTRWYDMGKNSYPEVRELMLLAELRAPEETVPETAGTAPEPKETEPADRRPEMTLEDVLALSLKEELDCGDFWKFRDHAPSYSTTDYYPVDPLFSLYVGFWPTGGEPEYIYLRAEDGSGDRIDIREEDVAAFIAKYRDRLLDRALREVVLTQSPYYGKPASVGILVESHKIIAVEEETDSQGNLIATVYARTFSEFFPSKVDSPLSESDGVVLPVSATFQVSPGGTCTLLELRIFSGGYMSYVQGVPREILDELLDDRDFQYLNDQNTLKAQAIWEEMQKEQAEQEAQDGTE